MVPFLQQSGSLSAEPNHAPSEAPVLHRKTYLFLDLEISVEFIPMRDHIRARGCRPHLLSQNYFYADFRSYKHLIRKEFR